MTRQNDILVSRLRTLRQQDLTEHNERKLLTLMDLFRKMASLGVLVLPIVAKTCIRVQRVPVCTKYGQGTYEAIEN